MALAAGPGLTNGRRVVRAVAVMAFGAGLGLGGARVVGTRLEPILLAPVLLAAVTGWLMARLTVVVRVIGQVVAFVGSGLMVAYASGGTAVDFGHGLFEGPRQVVTTSWPSPRWPTIFVALAALIFAAVAVSIDLAMRTRWRALAVAPLVVAMVAIIAVGAPDGPQWAPVLCAAAGTFALLWIGLDDRVASVRSGSVVAVVTGLAALTATLAVAISQRANPRHGEDANRELSLLDPLAEVSAQSQADPPRTLYEVESPSLDQLHRWRTASLDVYNGESWSTEGRLTPVGSRLGAGTGAEQISVTITALREDTLLWASPGALLRTSSPVETDSDRRVVRIVGSERPAVNVFTVESLAGFDPTTAGAMATILPTDIENSYQQLAKSLAGAGTVAEQVAQLAKTLHDDYTYDSGIPGGVQLNLVDRFLRETKLGNLEQFVTGFVLLARSLGVDAHIATGYQFEPTLSSDTITTAAAAAWPEVHVANGWVAVEVLPEDTNEPVVPPPHAGRADTPPAAQPPDPPDVEQVIPNEPVVSPAPPPKAGAWATVRVWAVRGGLLTAVLLWPLVVFATVVTFKKRRRRKGLKASDPGRRVTTAWTLATDALVDAGATLQSSHTNAELVEAGVATQPAAGSPLGRLQRHADAVTFTAGSCDPRRAVDAVDQLRLIESSIRNSSTRWWRWKWWLSTRSLRRRTQSPLR
jgi:transglutaminase TgpA-like protein/transglutaminase superfamily protein